MRWRNMLPGGLKDFMKLLRVRRRYPGRMIFTPYVHPTAELGVDCRLHRQVQVGSRVRIGDYSYVNDGTLIGSGTIGKFCSIAYYCEIGMHEHPLDYVSTSPFIYGTPNIFAEAECWNDFPSPPIVGNDVWIASGAKVLQGVRISDGAVVAAGAVVTKDVPPYAIVAGVPARIIRYRFGPEQIERLLTLQWWNMSPAELLRNGSFFRAGKDWFRHLPAATVASGRKAA
jgi:acetyltransferase-like isoleucine patch superfamily enzyme